MDLKKIESVLPYTEANTFRMMRLLREAANLTQEFVAGIFRLKQSTYSRVEQGKIALTYCAVRVTCYLYNIDPLTEWGQLFYHISERDFDFSSDKLAIEKLTLFLKNRTIETKSPAFLNNIPQKEFEDIENQALLLETI